MPCERSKKNGRRINHELRTAKRASPWWAKMFSNRFSMEIHIIHLCEAHTRIHTRSIHILEKAMRFFFVIYFEKKCTDKEIHHHRFLFFHSTLYTYFLFFIVCKHLFSYTTTIDGMLYVTCTHTRVCIV